VEPLDAPVPLGPPPALPPPLVVGAPPLPVATAPPVPPEDALAALDVAPEDELVVAAAVGVQHCSSAGPGQKPGVDT